MRKKRHKIVTRKKQSRYLFPLIISGFLLVGIVVAIYQVQQRQQIDSKAELRLSNCTVSAADLAVKASEQKMLTELNAYRATKGAGALKMDTNLKRAAQWLSNDMNAKDYLDHTDSAGRDPDKRYDDCGVTGTSGWGENILMGLTDPSKALADWKSSAGHNQNMLDKSFTHVGIAISGSYWTQAFATMEGGSEPPPQQPVPSSTCLGSCPSTEPTEPEEAPEEEETPPEEEEEPSPPDGEEPSPPEGEEGMPPEGEEEAPTVVPTTGTQVPVDTIGNVGNSNAAKLVLLVVIFLTIFLGFKPLLKLLKGLFKRP